VSRYYIVWDFETTGIPAHHPGLVRPVEVGITIYDGEFAGHWSHSIIMCPDVWAPSYVRAEAVHGISRTSLMMDGYPSMGEAFDQLAVVLANDMKMGLLAYATEVYSLAWNAAFDSEVLRLWMRAAGREDLALADWPDAPIGPFTAPAGCLQAMYREWTKTQPDLHTPRYGSLRRACEELGLAWDESSAHGASYDSHAAGRVAHAMLSREARRARHARASVTRT
jgi:hypothetical protein